MEQQTHKRRVHYKGTHPRTYQEKYKELNPEKYKIYFGEELEIDNYKVEQLIEFRKISFYEPISLDFRPNFNKVCMNIEDTFILNCIFYNSQPGNCSIELEDDAPLSFIKSDKYENPERI